MASLPSFEAILLEIHQSLGRLQFPSKVKDKFSNLGLESQNHSDTAEDILSAIFKSLNLDEMACRDATANMVEWAVFHKAVELETWTQHADARQVLWLSLSHSYVPGIARRLAFWNLEGAFDAGMPGGKFWFLPGVDTETLKVEMPTTQVLDWLFGLLGTSISEAADHLGSPTSANGTQDSIERTLRSWRTGKDIPRAKSIEAYFPDSATPEFKGTFSVTSNLSDTEQFANALEFVTQQQLTAENLRHQIPMTQPDRIEKILDQSAPAEEKREFVRLLLSRYAQPSMQLIRQRLLVASMVHDGYRRLLKFLCPDIEESCTDPAQNKLLQLLEIFKHIYNLTIDAWRNCDGIAAENSWFESQLSPWDQVGIFLSILPSRQKTSYLELATLLNRRFEKMVPNEPLEDLRGWDDASEKIIILNTIQRLSKEMDEDKRAYELAEKLHVKRHWKILQDENDFSVIHQIARSEVLGAKGRWIAIERMKELAKSPADHMRACPLELKELLDAPVNDRPKDAQARVEAVLIEALSHPNFMENKAHLLQFQAKHFLAKNDFEGAEKVFREALDACSERNYGRLRGEIARDALATAVANQRLNSNNYAKYHRNMQAYGMFEDKVYTLEDTAVWAADYFWDNLYKPYRDVESLKPIAVQEAEIYINETLPMIMYANWEGLEDWLKRNAKLFRTKHLREVRGNTVLMAWMKMRYTLEDSLPMLHSKTAPDLADGFKKMEAWLDNWHHAIRLLIAAWPEQVQKSDFKGQTPLMLAADGGDERTVNALLLAGADVNSREFQGRTALHSAVLGNSMGCLEAILRHQPETKSVTYDEGQTALHTAARMGYTEMFATLLAYQPSLKATGNLHGFTALDLVQSALDDFQSFQTFMDSNQRRKIGSKSDYERILGILDTPPHH